MKTIGSINPCNILYLYDDKEKCIGECLDTPNSFAMACLLYPNKHITIGKTFYLYFGEETRSINDKDIKERIKSLNKFKKNFPDMFFNDINYHLKAIKIY